MNNPHVLFFISLAGAALALMVSGAGIALLARMRRHAKTHGALATRLEHELAEISADLDTAVQRATDQARRIAWLETRLSPRAAGNLSGAEANWSPSAKPNMTERRHRVLSLARRGQDSQSIAATLGMPRGEVELMINLSAAA